ncbi:MAG: methylmalonyl-CoA mutase small subunit, partial [Bacteroidales bacterium]|nr:methylmalonyl-CoA mutase small subunit [Bacteroidales bacterium]
MADSNERLFQEFPPISTSQWEQVIEKDLRGADYEKKLVWRSPDKLLVRPYYRSEDLESVPEPGEPGNFPFTRSYKSTDNSWLIRQDIIFINPEESSQTVVKLFDRGVQSFGVKAPQNINPDELAQFIVKLPIKSIELNFIDFDPFVVLDALNSLCHSGGFSPDDFKGCLGIDPIENFILTGKLGDEDDTYDQLAAVIQESLQYPGIRVLDIHASHFHNAGSTVIQSIAFALGVANEYLDEFTERDLSIEEIARKFSFTFAVGSNYFFELAKFRSFRSLWSRIIESYGAKDLDLAKTHIHAETSHWNMTLYDPYVNLLRTTTESMSSILGGIDSLTVGRFDEVFNNEDDFSQRLARNQQLV